MIIRLSASRVSSGVVLAILVLIIIPLMRAYVQEELLGANESMSTLKPNGNSMISGTLTPDTAQPPDIALLRPAKLDLEKENERDIAEIYPLGQPSTPLFSNAQWIFNAEGGFAFIAKAPQRWLIGDIDILGRYERRGNAFEFHGKFRSSRDGTLTLDGFIHPVSDGFQMDAIYTVSIRSFQQIERIMQWLALKPDGTIPEDVAQRLRTIVETPGRPDAKRFLSEPTSVVQGIPVPSIYGITLRGRTEAGEFSPFSGRLFVYPSKPDTGNPVSIKLMPNGPVRHGWLVWESEQDRLGTTERIVNNRIRLKDGRIEATILRGGPITRFLTWYTLDDKSPGATNNVPVHAESGTFKVEIQNDRVVGTVLATGSGLGDTPKPSSYEANLIGEREGSKLLGGITETVGARLFSGRWMDKELGVIELRQAGDSVTGSYTGSTVSVTGIIRDDRLDFDWQNARGGQGKGFLRALEGGGTLAGLQESGPKTAGFQAIIAEAPRNELTKIPTEPAPGDIRELKYLGYDLVSQGKCQQAAEILSTVVDFYKTQAKASTQPMEQEDFLVSQGLPLTHLVNCYFELGSYDKLFARLEDVLALEEMLTPEQLWRMRFQNSAGKLTPVLIQNIELLTTIEEATTALLEQAQSGGIGVALDPAQNPKGVVLSAVTEGMPAAAAGLMAGDVLVRIDGRSTAGMTLDEVSGLLRGEPSSKVEVVIRRAGRDIEHILIRAPILALGASHRKRIFNGLRKLAERAAAWRTSLTSALDDIEALKQRLDERKADVVRSAFKELQAISSRTHGDMATAVTDVIALGHSMLRAAPVLHGYYATMLEYLKAGAADQLVDMTRVTESQDLEAKIAKFLEQDRETSWLEKEIYRRQVALLPMLYTVSFELKAHADSIGQMEVERNYEKVAASARAGLQDLPLWIEQWRARLVTDAAKIQALQESQEFFRRYISLLVEFNELNAALVASESARSRAFLDLLAARSATGTGAWDSTTPSTDLISLATAPPLSLADIQETVRTGETTIIEYFLLDDRMLIWRISPAGTIEMRRVPVARAKLEQDVERFVTLVERPHEDESREERAKANVELSELLKRFHTLLISPVKDLLPQSANDLVTIVPHGHLFHIPFAALKVGDKNKARFLVEDHTLVYVPSIGVLRHIQRMKRGKPQNRPPTLLALVNPTLSYDAVDSEDNPLKPLPITEQNFSKIARYYTGTGSNRILAGTAATKVAFLAEAHDHDVIYFATHAEAIETDPRRSYIALADERLRVLDVAMAMLQADLVILGACETGRGRITGDGVEGLSRLFIWAGAPTLLATLWEVPEHQTLNQSFLFHEHWLSQGKSKAAALREAQLQGRWDFQDQIEAWAGFIMVGVWR